MLFTRQPQYLSGLIVRQPAQEMDARKLRQEGARAVSARHKGAGVGCRERGPPPAFPPGGEASERKEGAAWFTKGTTESHSPSMASESLVPSKEDFSYCGQRASVITLTRRTDPVYSCLFFFFTINHRYASICLYLHSHCCM